MHGLNGPSAVVPVGARTSGDFEDAGTSGIFEDTGAGRPRGTWGGGLPPEVEA